MIPDFVPSNLSQTIVSLYREEGKEWLQKLPLLLKECKTRWSLEILPAFTNLSYHYVTSVVGPDGEKLVLKLGVPNEELSSEIEALRIYDGQGIARLIDADKTKGVLLLERLQPGFLLSDVASEEEAISIAAHVMKNLWKPVPQDHNFPTVGDWAEGLQEFFQTLDTTNNTFPRVLVKRALEHFEYLSKTTKKQVVLHGDLHHFNILSATRKPWLAIDPKGIIGDPVYEIGAFLRNPSPAIFQNSSLKRIQMRRIEKFSNILGFEKERILKWAMYQAVLSAYWSYGEENSFEKAKPCLMLAELFDQLLLE